MNITDHLTEPQHPYRYIADSQRDDLKRCDFCETYCPIELVDRFDDSGMHVCKDCMPQYIRLELENPK